MNYAEDRLDRRARHEQSTIPSSTSNNEKKYVTNNSLILSDLRRVHDLLSQYSNDSSSLEKLKGAHELAGRTLRDCGLCRHASFHYGMAWMCDVNDAARVGDYAQMVEFCGYPEIGVISLLFYFAGGKLESNVQSSWMKDGGGEIASFIEDSILGNKNDNDEYDELCGTSQCFIPPEMINSEVTQKILCAFTSLDKFIGSKDGQNNSNTTQTAADILQFGEMIKKKPSNAETYSKSFANLTDGVNHILKFWEDDDNQKKNKNEDYDYDHKKRKLSPLLKILLLKLLYCTPSLGGSRSSSFLFLACEAVRHFSITMPTTSSSKLGRQMARDYKSHWAYYVLIKAVVLGERVKKHRRNSVIPYHVPVWDIVHGNDERNLNMQYSDEQKQLKSETNDAESSVGRSNESNTATVIEELMVSLGTSYKQEQSPTALLPDSPPLNKDQLAHEPIFALGDSHVLSLGWQTLEVPTEEKEGNNNDMSIEYRYRTIIPYPVTGLKAWHVRQDTKFFTHSNLRSCLQRLPLWYRRNRSIILSAGEIDCREGIGGKQLEGYNTTSTTTGISNSDQSDSSTRTSKFDYDAAVRNTVVEYLKALHTLAQEFELQQILLMPVAPHAYRSEKNGKAKGRAVRRERMLVWNNVLRELLPASPVPPSTCNEQQESKRRIYLLDYEEGLRSNDETSPVGFVLNKVYNADFTHMNSAFLPLLEKSIKNCGCDFNLL